MKYKDFFKELLVEGFKDCVMAEIPPTTIEDDEESITILSDIYAFINKIPDDVLFNPDNEHGKEKWPHVTILYGLENGLSDEAKKIVNGYGKKIKVKLGKISKFENEKFDVLKIDVDSEDLDKINEELKKLPNENSYPDYKPHVTLAYVKSGECGDLVGCDDFDGIEVEIDKIIYSDSNRSHIRILEGQFIGTGGGYGGAAGGSIAATGWAACYGPSPQNMMSKYPIRGGTKNFKNSITGGTQGSRYSPTNGNTVINSAPYDNVNDDDLEVEGIDKDELFLGIRHEMRKVKFANKEMAKQRAIANIRTDPRYYSDLKQFMNEEKINLSEIVKIVTDLQAERNSRSSATNHPCSKAINDAVQETIKGRSIRSINSILSTK
jgi:hypothetical protein